MKQRMYAIRNSKAECYNTPFFQKTHGEAERSFRELTRDSNSMVSKYPDDYDLWYLGEYDTTLGTVNALQTPQHILKAVNIPNQPPAAQNAIKGL